MCFSLARLGYSCRSLGWREAARQSTPYLYRGLKNEKTGDKSRRAWKDFWNI